MPQEFFQQIGPDHVTADLLLAFSPSDLDKQLFGYFLFFLKPLHIDFAAASISLLCGHLFYLL